MPARRPAAGRSLNGCPGTAPSPLPIRGRVRLGLIRDLAMGEWDYSSLARQTGFSARDIEAFAEEHAEEIAEVSQALSGQLPMETAGLWLTKKQNRLAEYQAEIEDIEQTIEELRANGVGWSRAHRDMLRIKIDLFRQAADELGAYPQRAAAPARQGSTVHYVIETDDNEAMT
jgi:hypothetical protein